MADAEQEQRRERQRWADRQRGQPKRRPQPEETGQQQGEEQRDPHFDHERPDRIVDPVHVDRWRDQEEMLRQLLQRDRLDPHVREQ